MKTKLLFIMLFAVVFSVAAVVAAAPDGANFTYLPLVRKPADPADVNVYQYLTPAGGDLTIPLTGGGTADFQITDFLGEPLPDLDVTAIENSFGVTLIIGGERAGYAESFHPVLASFGPGLFSAPEYYHAIEAVQVVGMVPVNQSNRYAGGGSLIIEHLQGLPGASPDWDQETGDIGDYCQRAVAPESWGSIVGQTIQGTLAAGTGAPEENLRVMMDIYGNTGGAVAQQECLDLLAGPGNYDQRIISNPDLGANLFVGEFITSNPNGVIYGRVADDGTGASLAGANILLGTTLNAPEGGLADTESFPNGWFRLEGVAEGSYELQVTRPGYAPYTTNVNVSEGGVADAGETPIVLTDPATLLITNDSGGIATFRIYQYGLELLEDIFAVDDEIEYELSPGDYTLWVSASTCPNPGTANITLEPNQFLHLYIVCVRAPEGPAAGTAAFDLPK